MPAVETIPGGGSAVVASGQVLYSRVAIIRTNFPNFAPVDPPDTAPVGLRTRMATAVRGLTKVLFHVFQYPQYDRGDVTYRARNNLEWRPVFLMPPDDKLDMTGITTNDWLPVCSPILMIPGVPVIHEVFVGGFQFVSFEVKAGAAGANQGEDRVAFQISAGI